MVLQVIGHEGGDEVVAVVVAVVEAELQRVSGIFAGALADVVGFGIGNVLALCSKNEALLTFACLASRYCGADISLKGLSTMALHPDFPTSPYATLVPEQARRGTAVFRARCIGTPCPSGAPQNRHRFECD